MNFVNNLRDYRVLNLYFYGVSKSLKELKIKKGKKWRLEGGNKGINTLHLSDSLEKVCNLRSARCKTASLLHYCRPAHLHTSLVHAQSAQTLSLSALHLTCVIKRFGCPGLKTVQSSTQEDAETCTGSISLVPATVNPCRTALLYKTAAIYASFDRLHIYTLYILST